jgi:hypothetical protein
MTDVLNDHALRLKQLLIGISPLIEAIHAGLQKKGAD